MEAFINSGHFIPVEKYLESNPDAQLLADCTDVVEYMGGHIIQLLKSGEFYVDETFSSKSLDEAEIKLFKKI